MPLPTMQALVFDHAAPDARATRVAEMPVPRPGVGEVAIDVAFAGINFKDVMARRGDSGYVRAWPFVPGLEVAGTVREVGAGVATLAPGHRVIGLTNAGGLAQVAVAGAQLTARVPERVDLVDAAPVPGVLTTAQLLLHSFARVRPGDTVLVHSAGGSVGRCRQSDAACFSFHPVKTIAAGEGGALTLNDPARAERARRLRNHGVTREAALMREPGSFGPDGRAVPWVYEQLELGFNLRLDEMSAALGLSQLAKLQRFVKRRRALAAAYDVALAPLAPRVRVAPRPPHACWGLHLYTLLLDEPRLAARRGAVIGTMAAAGIGAQVHYIPLYRQPYFRERYGPLRLAGAEAYYSRVLALPLHPSMRDADVDRVVAAVAVAIGD